MLKEPIRVSGPVIRGFGRGGKDLGTPTANIDPSSYDGIITEEKKLDGVYYGYAQLNDGPVEEMVMSIGKNPQYDNEHLSVEVHILKDFEEDFYGEHLDFIILGFIRPMVAFDSLEQLITTIENDKTVGKEELSKPEAITYKSDALFTSK